jgi:hypothetical protein
MHFVVRIATSETQKKLLFNKHLTIFFFWIIKIHNMRSLFRILPLFLTGAFLLSPPNLYGSYQELEATLQRDAQLSMQLHTILMTETVHYIEKHMGTDASLLSIPDMQRLLSKTIERLPITLDCFTRPGMEHCDSVKQCIQNLTALQEWITQEALEYKDPHKLGLTGVSGEILLEISKLNSVLALRQPLAKTLPAVEGLPEFLNQPAENEHDLDRLDLATKLAREAKFLESYAWIYEEEFKQKDLVQFVCRIFKAGLTILEHRDYPFLVDDFTKIDEHLTLLKQNTCAPLASIGPQLAAIDYLDNQDWISEFENLVRPTEQEITRFDKNKIPLIATRLKTVYEEALERLIAPVPLNPLQ